MKYLVLFFVGAFFIFAQGWGLFLTPADSRMGEVQKLMYLHVPAAWNSFLAFFIVFVSSLVYLFRKKLFWDRLAESGAEVGCLMTALTLALGSLWGKPTWGVWWTWDPRLTTTAILLLLYLGYLSLRGFLKDSNRRARLCAPIGVLIFLNVPIVYYSVKWWRTLHQEQSSPATIDPEMVLALRLNAFAFLGVLILLITYRYRLSRRRELAEEEKSLPPRLSRKMGGLS